jgi:lactate dehydrogenase-like 2-hydroxyacid dehydrogenase
MVPKRVFITRSLLSDGARYLADQGFQVETNSEDRILSALELLQKTSSCEALITTLSDRIDREFLKANPQLKIIANYAVGFNNIDLVSAREQGILITNTPDVLTEATAETAMGLMIAAARQFHEAASTVRNGDWKSWHPQKHLGPSLQGKTLGIIGLGRIGKRLAEMAHYAFQMPILYTAHTKKETAFRASKVSLQELLEKSDFVSIHVPLSDETRGMIGAPEFSRMKKTAVLVNTARGEVIDQEALISALKTKSLFSAGLDVMTPEPLTLTSELMGLSNVFLLPHIGSATFEARREMAMLCARNVAAGLRGEPLLTPV